MGSSSQPTVGDPRFARSTQCDKRQDPLLSGSSHRHHRCNSRPAPLCTTRSTVARSRAALLWKCAEGRCQNPHPGEGSGKDSAVSGSSIWPFVPSQAAEPLAPLPCRRRGPQRQAPITGSADSQPRLGGAPGPARRGSAPRGPRRAAAARTL